MGLVIAVFEEMMMQGLFSTPTRQMTPVKDCPPSEPTVVGHVTYDLSTTHRSTQRLIYVMVFAHSHIVMSIVKK